MLRQNELRCGNLIRVVFREKVGASPDERIVTVTPAIISQVAMASGQDTRFGEYCGIELTEKWLELLGFDCLEDDLYTKEGIKVWVTEDNVSRTFYHINSEVVLYFKYVHELQNYYFVVSGEELR